MRICYKWGHQLEVTTQQSFLKFHDGERPNLKAYNSSD